MFAHRSLSKNRPSANSRQTAAANCALFFTHLANCFRRVRFTPVASHTVSVVNRLFRTHWLTGQVPPNHKKACALEGRRISKSFSSSKHLRFHATPLAKPSVCWQVLIKVSTKIQTVKSRGLCQSRVTGTCSLNFFSLILKSWIFVSLERWNHEH